MFWKLFGRVSVPNLFYSPALHGRYLQQHHNIAAHPNYSARARLLVVTVVDRRDRLELTYWRTVGRRWVLTRRRADGGVECCSGVSYPWNVRSAVSDVSWSSEQAGSTAVGGRPSIHGGCAAAESSDQRRVIIKRGRRWRRRRLRWRRGGRGKYKKDVRSCGVWHVFFLHSLVVVCNGFLQFARVYYGDGSDSYLILDIPTVPHSRLNEPLSTRTV